MKFIRVIKAKLEIPDVLYHATYKPLLKSIKKEGLVPGKRINWDNGNNKYKNYIYLADDPGVAESYAEASELVAEDWLDNIVILQVSTNNLDKTKFEIDENNQDGSTLQYNGTIPPSCISIYED